jgi:dienelactone hydrolase
MSRRMSAKQIVIAVLVIFGLPALLYVLAALNEAFFGTSTSDFFPDGMEEPLWYPEGIDPDSYDGPALPAVLLVSDQFSIDSDMALKARLLSQYGYVVRIPDLYDGRHSRGIPGMRILRRVTGEERMFARVGEAWESLLADPLVNPERTALAGFDLGAELAVRLGTQDPRPVATVLFYPGELPGEGDEIGTLGIGGPVLAIFAADDTRLSLEDQAGFAALLNAAGRDFDRTIYEDENRNFVKAREFTRVGAPIRAWLEFLTFLQDEIQTPQRN